MSDTMAMQNQPRRSAVASPPDQLWKEIAAFLEAPAAYSEDCPTVEVRETHISRVYLTDRFAYKLKKPVTYDFLDFSTPQLRQQACEHEVRLNRRLAPDVYFKVTPVHRTASGGLKLGGSGQPVEWLVKMRRLEDQRSLENLILSGRLTASEVQQLAEYLAAFYVAQAPVVLRSSDFRQRLLDHIASNRRELTQLLPAMADHIALLHSLQQRYVPLLQDMFDNRVCDGRVVDGHGDLRPEHVYLEPSPVVIDCIEFNAEYRCNDIVDDLAFLSMECDRLGAAHVGARIMQAYCRQARDAVRPGLIEFYKCYRACVRAKVVELARRQKEPTVDGQPAQRYLELAKHYAQALGPPIIVLVGGLMGSGKSTLAERVAQECQAPWLQTDAIRRQHWGASQARDGYGQGRYQAERRAEVYQLMMRRAAEALQRHALVVLDGSFSQSAMRRLALQCARENGAQLLQVQCSCPVALAQSRIQARAELGHSASEARPELLAAQQAECQPPLPEVPLCEMDTREELSGQWERIRRHLAALLP